MAIEPISQDQILAQVDQRDSTTGVLTPPVGMQPYYHWLMESLQLLSDASCGALRVVKDDASDTTIRIMPGRATISGTVLDVATTTRDLATFNNLTVYVWLEDDTGSAKVDVASSVDGWPVATHIKLAEVTVTAGVITDLLDRRFETLFSV